MKQSETRQAPWRPWLLLLGLALGALGIWWFLPGDDAPSKQRAVTAAARGPSTSHGQPLPLRQGLVDSEDVVAAGDPGGPRRTCSFEVGDRLGYQVSMSASAMLDLGDLDLGTGSPVQAVVDPARDMNVEASWHLDLQALVIRSDGSTVLAAHIDRDCQEVLGLPGTDSDSSGGDMTPVFLVRMDRSCAMTEFARWDGVDLQGARSQQALMLSLQWRYPEDGEAGPYQADERDATGTYRAKYALVEGADEALVVRKIIRYLRLHRPDRTGGASSNLRISGKGLMVHPGEGPWFESLESQQTTGLQVGQASIGQAESGVEAGRQKPREPKFDVDPRSPKWIWGDLLALAPDAPKAALAEVPEWIRRLSMEEALARYNQLATNPDATFRDWVDLMRDWIRSHSDQIPTLLQALKKGKLQSRQGEPAVFFAMALADLPEAREGLRSMVRDRSFGSMNRSRAAVALVGCDDLPEGFVEELILMSRGTGAGGDVDREDVVTMAPTLGILANRQRDKAPEAASKAGDELVGRLSTETESWRVAAVLSGVGNIGDDSVLEAVEPFLANEDPQLRTAAAYALRGLSPEGAAGLYAPTLKMERDPGVRKTLVHAYWNQAFTSHQAPPGSVVQESVNALFSETDLSVTKELVGLLGLAAERGDETAKAALAERMKAELDEPERNLELLQLLGQFQ